MAATVQAVAGGRERRLGHYAVVCTAQGAGERRSLATDGADEAQGRRRVWRGAKDEAWCLCVASQDLLEKEKAELVMVRWSPAQEAVRQWRMQRSGMRRGGVGGRADGPATQEAAPMGREAAAGEGWGRGRDMKLG